MSSPSKALDSVCEKNKVIYWTHPIFTKTGMVDTEKMIHFLTHTVPNNYFKSTIENTWNPGEDFEIQFLDMRGENTISYTCRLDIHGDASNHVVVCSLCKGNQEDDMKTHISKRAEEIAKLISGEL